MDHRKLPSNRFPSLVMLTCSPVKVSTEYLTILQINQLALSPSVPFENKSRSAKDLQFVFVLFIRIRRPQNLMS